jgi:hypothetical protein
MIKILGKKLIIEIDCKDNNPLSILGGIQTGVMNMIEVANLNNGENGFNTLDWGITQISRLMKEMLLTGDQMVFMSDNMEKDEISKFNECLGESHF